MQWRGKAKYRKPSDDITLMAVTKTVAPEAVNHAKLRHSYPGRKPGRIPSKKDFYSRIKVHFIGHLQTNKVKYIIEDMDLIHSVDSIKLATEIDRHAARVNKVQDILIEVNVGGEASKSGIAPDQLEELLHEAGQLSHVHVRGLMTIPPVEGDEKFLYKMQQLYLDISSKKMDNIDMEILSMGMSGDFAAAIRYGSTLVRIGTALFGARNYQK
ncbi:MAG: YggS family pyridoxal phosphate-dependent enzyme [Ruminococcus sp.]